MNLYDFFAFVQKKKFIVKDKICYRSMHDIIIFFLNKCQKGQVNSITEKLFIKMKIVIS